MRSGTLKVSIRAYRIGDPTGRNPVWSTEGAKHTSGRWHEAGAEIIYASENYSTALLEKLVHCNGVLPPNQYFVEITIPEGTSYEVATPDTLPDWSIPGSATARRFGHGWYRKNRSAILIVPSVVARMERNIVINSQHSDFRRMSAGMETPVWWDQRLFPTLGTP